MLLNQNIKHLFSGSTTTKCSKPRTTKTSQTHKYYKFLSSLANAVKSNSHTVDAIRYGSSKMNSVYLTFASIILFISFGVFVPFISSSGELSTHSLRITSKWSYIELTAMSNFLKVSHWYRE